MAKETLSEILYETHHHASGPCFPNYPPQQVIETANLGVLSLLSTRGLTQIKEKWTAYRQPKKLKRLVALFVSPKGERVAVAVGNHITILRKDEDYQQPYGTFASNNTGAFTLGVWSESHDVLGIVDDVDTFYFIKSNGEELLRIERRHLKTTLPIVGLFVPDVTETRGSLLCNFNFLTSDGTLHCIETSQDLSASLSSIRTWSDIKRQFSLNFFGLDHNLEHSLLVLVGGPTNISLTTSSPTVVVSPTGCTLSVWRWSPKSDLLHVSSLQFEGVYSRPKGFRGLIVSPKVLISPHGKFIGTLDLRARLSIFKLNVDSSSLSLFACGETNNNFLEDIVDFTWWSDHVCTVAKKGGATTMFDVISGKKLLDNDPMFSVPVLERTTFFSGKVFVLDIPLLRERQNYADQLDISYIHDIEQYTEGSLNQVETSRLSWRLLSFSEKSVPEMYDVLINSHRYQSALDFADRYKLDKDQVFKFQWLHSAQGSDEVHMFLYNVKDEAFVLRECVEKVGHTEDAVRDLLAYGLNLTNRYKFSAPEYDICEHVWDFRLARLQLLQFRDRLETFLGVNMGRFSLQEYSKFRKMLIDEAAVKLAENGKIGALNLLFKRHPFSCSPFILKILGAIPETIQVQTFSQLLPGRSPPSVTALREKDWVECEDMLEYIRRLPENDERSVLVRTEPIIKQLFGISWPLTNEILIWYKERAQEIDNLSGQLDNSICLVDYGCRRGMYELQQFLDDIRYLQQLVYSEGNDDEMHCPISLIEWEHMSDYEKFKTILKGVKEENIVERLRFRAIPFMKNKLDLGGEDQRGSFLVRWLKENAAQKIEFCSVAIEEWSRDVQSGFFVDEMEAAECALQCIYLCNAMDKWNTMASILSKFPNARGSDIRSEGIEKRLKSVEGHIEAGRLLALYQVPKPVSFFHEAQNDDKAVKQILRLILSKFARRQPARSDNDWASMWRDLQCLQEKAFPFIDLEYMLMEFCRGLLKAGRFSLARNYLRGTGTISLPTDKAESLVIQTAREYFFSASSLSSPEIWKARDCLDLFPTSPTVRLEADVIEALTVKLPNLGVNVLPMQYKQIKDPMEIVKMAITSQAGAYINVDEIIEVAKLLGLGSQENILAVQEAIAREAAVAGDLQLAFDLCLILARKGHGFIWDLCAAIARGPAIENIDLGSRKQLLGFALCHCDDESIGDLLNAWKDLDMQAQFESLMMQTGTPDFVVKGSSIISAPGVTAQSGIVGDFSEDEDTYLSKIKVIIYQVAKPLPVADGTSWDDVLRENRKVLSFANLQLPWLVQLSCESEPVKNYYPISVPGKQYVSVRTQAVITILSWLARNGFAPRDDLISSMAKFIMEPPVTEEDDVVGCSFLLNLTDAFHGVEVIEQQLKTREDYQEICSIMNVGMVYSLLHNSGATCKDPFQRRELLWRKFQEKISSELDKVEKVQATFWRGWKLKLEEQKRMADRTRVLEELIPGVETARFLSGDLQYMNNAIMSFIDSVKLQKKPILREVLKLADTYSLNRTEVLLKFLACALVSEVWSNEEIDAEISDFKGEILDSATKTIDVITSIVYPVIDGCNKARLAYLFAQLSDCYLHLVETKGLHPSEIQDLGDSSVTLGHFYQVHEQECYNVSFITDLNFKNIVDINLGRLNSAHFNDEVLRHVNEFTVEALAKMVQTLHSTVASVNPKDIVSWRDVYKHHVVTLLESLEYRAKKIHLENPDSLQSLLNDFEQTYDACRKHIRILEHQSALVIMKQYCSGVVPLHFVRESVHTDVSLKDCLIVLLNFWMKLNADMVEMAESSDEKLTAVSLMICLKVFMRLVVEGKVTPSQGWGTVYFFVNCSLSTSPAGYFSFCRAMILSGCEFGSVEAVFSEALSECCSIDQGMSSDTKGGNSYYLHVCNLYLNILESILSNLVHDDSQRHSLHNLLSSVSRLEGDLEVLNGVRTAVWERIAKFSDNLQLPSHIRVYVLEVLQFILGRKGKVSREQEGSILPWEEWNEWSSSSKNTELTEEQALPNQSEGPNRFKNSLVALKTTELAGSISSHMEISADDLLTVDSAVSCFENLCETVDTHAHFEALLAILGEWETLFLVEKTKEASAEVSGVTDADNNWNDWGDEGWERESFLDEEPIQEEKTESSVSIHPLHACWMEILRKLIMLSRFDEVVKLIDQSLERPEMVLINEDDASNLSNMLIDSDCFMALKTVLLLPYGTIHLRCLDAIENKLKLEGIPENSDKNLLILVLSSGIISTIISKPAHGATFSYICYLVGEFSRQSQNTLVSKSNQNLMIDDEIEGFCLTFVQILFPCFVSELVKANQQVLAGFLVTKFMHTNPSLCLINVAEAGLSKYLRSHIQLLECRESAAESRIAAESRKPEILGHTLSNLEVKLKDLIPSALLLLPNS
ncbi:MAG2-interacting protein 2 isoform X2 [Spinacia oleracea]|uniref:MAG2-interacting protein 2 isoform X2 n=1 Tax=Spinacia oleracea TaxID=3562 RepID=A0A9R0ISR4_SPIOL|nr:MAG2-interacting protein 2 isoform X2 [Spinacia oleracea]